MLLDLSGLTREERVQASISNERDLDRVVEALIIQHPRIHFRESQRRAKGKGKDGCKRVDNSNTCWFRGKGKGKHTGSGKPGASAHHANLTSVEDYDYYYDEEMDESGNAYQAHNDPGDPASDNGEEALDYDDRVLPWIMLPFSRQLNWTRLLFLLTHGTMILIPRCTQLVHSSAQVYLSFGQDQGKGEGNVFFQLVYTKSDTYSSYGDTTTSCQSSESGWSVFRSQRKQ